MKLVFNKKGNVLLETFFIILVLFVVGITGIVSYKFFGTINDDIQKDLDLDSDAREEFNHLHTRFPSTMDGIFAVCFGLLWIMTIIAAFLIDSHPVFFVVSIVILLSLLFVGGLISNVYEEIETDDMLSDSASSFPITSWILTHLLHVMVVLGGSIALALYGKSKVG